MASLEQNKKDYLAVCKELGHRPPTSTKQGSWFVFLESDIKYALSGNIIEGKPPRWNNLNFAQKQKEWCDKVKADYVAYEIIAVEKTKQEHMADFTLLCEKMTFRPTVKTKGLTEEEMIAVRWFYRIDDIPYTNTEERKEVVAWRNDMMLIPTQMEKTRNENIKAYEPACIENDCCRPELCTELGAWFSSFRMDLKRHITGEAVLYEDNIWAERCLSWTELMVEIYQLTSEKERTKVLAEFTTLCKEKGFRPSQLSSDPHERELVRKINGYKGYMSDRQEGREELETFFKTVFDATPTEKFFNAYHNTNVNTKKHFYKNNAELLGISIDNLKQISCNELWQDIQKAKAELKKTGHKIFKGRVIT